MVKTSLFRLFLLLLSLLAELLAQSRSALGGMLISLVGMVVYLTGVGRLKKFVLYGGLMCMVFFALTLSIMPKSLFGVEMARLNSDGVNITDVSMETISEKRLYLVEATFAVLNIHPFGLGLSHHHPEVMLEFGGVDRNPHNFIMKDLLIYGWLGGLIMMIFYFLPIILCFVNKNNSLEFIVAVFAFIAIYLFNLAHSMVNWIYIWVFWAITIKLFLQDKSANGALPVA
ncbi:MAG: O-antigen ligase family protein [Cyclobacteriaceae bacterium]